MALLNGWLGLILGFSGLIFIHELGHFVLAKWNGVRVYVFSLGMGPYLLSFSHKGTVYALSMIPIGGYVKMMGQDDLNPVVDANPNPQDYRNKRAGQKAAILAAGAGFNIMFTIAIFTLCYWHGMDLESPRIGNVTPGSPLAEAVIKKADGTTENANLTAGDRIVAINGVPVKSMGEASLQIASSKTSDEILLEIDRQPPKNMVYVKARHDQKTGASTISIDPYYLQEAWGLGFTTKDSVVITGFPINGSTAKLGQTPDPGTPAEAAKLKAHDIIQRVNNTSVKQEKDAINAIRASNGKDITLYITRTEADKTIDEMPITITPTLNKDGYYSIGAGLDKMRLVDHVDEGSQAYAGGLREGDYFHTFEPSDAHWEGDRRVFSKGTLYWIKDFWNDKQRENPSKAEISGVNQVDHGGVVVEQLAMYPYKAAGGVWDALSVAWNDTLRGAGSVFTVLHGLLTGNLSPKALSGPLGIGKLIFQVSRSQAFIRYLWFLGFISLNLGVLQFVPIPLLDGWHLVEVFIEKLKGSPITPKVQQAFQLVGLVIVGTLLLYATFQDIMR